MLQSSFDVTSFVSEVVFLKMPSRQEKKRAKRRAKYLQVRDDVLESQGHSTAIHNIHSDFNDLGYEQKSRKHVTKNFLYEKVGGI